MAQAKMTREQVLEIPSLKRERMTDTALAEKYNVSRATISYWVKQLKSRGETWERVRGGGKKPLLSD